MFCGKCGTRNKDYSTYCINDGEKLQNSNVDVNMSKQQLQYCNDCGTPMKKYNTYCSECGDSNFTRTKDVTRIIKNKNNLEKNNIFKDMKFRANIKDSVESNNIDFKRILCLGSIGFITIFILGIILSYTTNSLISDEYGAIFTKVKLVNAKDLTLLFNSLKLDLNLLVYGSNSGSVSFEGGAFTLLLVPFIIFTIIGMISSQLDIKRNNKLNILNVLLPGVVYGLLLFLLSFIGKSSLNIPYIGFGTDVKLVKTFSALSALLRGILISDISILFGYGLYSKVKKEGNIPSNYVSVINGAFSFGIILLLMVFTIMIYLIKNDVMIASGVHYLGLRIVLILWLVPYVILFSNFGNNKIIEVMNNVNERYSIFKFGEDYSIYGEDIFTGFEPLVYISLFITFVILFMSGRKAKLKHDHSLKDIIYSSATYSICISILAYLINISASVEASNLYMLEMFEDIEYLSFSFGFGMFSVVIGSFILALLSSSAGYLLTNTEEQIRSSSYE